MEEYALQGPQGIHTEVVVHKQKNKTPHQNKTHNPYNTYTIHHVISKKKTKTENTNNKPCNIICKIDPTKLEHI